MKVTRRIYWISAILAGLMITACGNQSITPTTTPTIIPSATPTPSPTPKPTSTTISTTLICSDIDRAMKEGGITWAEFYASSIGAPLQFTGYVFQVDWDKDLISVYSDQCALEIWLTGIPHDTVMYTSYTQQVEGSGTIEDYPDKVYMDEVLVRVDLDTLVIH